jgi:hypothetical protein
MSATFARLCLRGCLPAAQTGNFVCASKTSIAGEMLELRSNNWKTSRQSV